MPEVSKRPNNESNSEIVSKLWSLCNILRDDGITFHQYVNELTYLLFLKMAQETNTEHDLPEGYRWEDLQKRTGTDQFAFYRQQLVVLGTQGNPLVRTIFANPTSLLRHAESLNTIVGKIDQLDWFSAKEEGLGDTYEGLLQKNASEKKSGAGQYFTPRALIDSIVRLCKPSIADVIQDPAAGTGGFLVAANEYILKTSNRHSWTSARQKKYRTNTFYGMEHVQDTHRLALMNLMLHGIEYEEGGAGIQYGDTLGPAGVAINRHRPTLVLTNPPFGTKRGGGLPNRTDLPFPTSNKQLCFLQHIYTGLEQGGRAAVVLPDNVLFEGNAGVDVRRDLMDKCNLHTILRLPTGIFYAQGVKTNVLFFNKSSKTAKNSTKNTWIFDMRSNMQQFGKRKQLASSHFVEFEEAYGVDPNGLSIRNDGTAGDRFRSFTREDIAARGDNLDITWLASDLDPQEDGMDLTDIAQEMLSDLEALTDEVKRLLSELGEGVSAE